MGVVESLALFICTIFLAFILGILFCCFVVINKASKSFNESVKHVEKKLIEKISEDANEVDSGK